MLRVSDWGNASNFKICFYRLRPEIIIKHQVYIDWNNFKIAKFKLIKR